MLRRFLLLAMVAYGLTGFFEAAWAAGPVEVATKVDASLLAELPTNAAKPMKKIGDEEFLRRAYLDIIGHIPSPEEVTAFVLDPAQDKRTKVVDKLLADERFGENWGRYFRDVIMYRKTEERAEIVSGQLEDYLKQQFNTNASWAKVATEMVTATGDGTENGACALIIAQQGHPEEVVSEVSRIFLGVQIQCAQCHDHPTDRWKREQFHELAAFFPRVASRVILTPDRRDISVVAQDNFPSRRFGMMGNMRRIGTAEHYMTDLKNPTAQGKLMEPVFFATGDKVPLGTKDADRRGSLAKWITEKENPYFAKAFVNRLWGELNGEGFYEPVDDIGPDRQCSAPLTLEFLAKEFGQQNYDIKWLFRTITATSLYQAPSAPRRNPDQTPMQNNVAQRLRGDQLFDNLLNALGVSEPKPPGMMAGNPFGRRFSPRGNFNTAFGYDPSERRDEIAGSIPQALLFMNGANVNAGIRASGRTALAKMLSDIKDDQALVTELYLRVLAREPSSSEMQTCLAYVKKVDNRNEAFEDLQWSLINSTEFLHRK
ncbi:MAG: DUF1549 and DUF1553 domain-containing protein [Planctomycetales bacterium]|nr:DUF1549 and DUF1553 domain-containing protein [Planctomycetales bacterium]